MFGLQAPELIVIALLILLLFGFKKLPDAARSIGRSARVFKSEMNEMKNDDKERQATGHTSIPGEATEQGPVTDRHIEPGPVLEDYSPSTDNQSGTAR
mgnify:FL=1